MPMSLNLKERAQVSNQFVKESIRFVIEVRCNVLIDKLLLFEGSPGGVGGLGVVRVLLWHLV